MDIREQLIAKAMGDCRHFNGIQHDCCNAGVNYEQLIEQGKYKIPCLRFAIGINRDPALCEKFSTMTREEAEEDADSLLDLQAKTMLAMRAAHEDAKRKGFRKGQGGHDSFPCPTGCGGHLYYRVASVNGPRPEDWVIHNCIVTHEGKDYADCICRKPAHKLDSVSGQYSLDCKIPKERK